jgi:hypothetical protein
MVLITRHNYEAYLLDYIEGNLSEQDTAGLMRFLDQNPELKQDLDDFDWVTLADNDNNFEGKDDLKIQAEVEELLIGRIEKRNSASDEARLNALLLAHPQFEKVENLFAATVLVNNTIDFSGKEDIKLQAEIDELLLGSIEHQNTTAEEARLKTLLVAHPQFEKEEKAYARTILAKENLVFPYKSELKQESRVVPIYFWYSAAAACIIGFMATFGWNIEASGDLQYAAGNVNLSTPALAIEKLPDFSIFNTSTDSSDTEQIEEPILITIPDNGIRDDQMASTSTDPEPKDVNTTDSTDKKITPAPMDILPTDEIAVIIDSVPSVMDSILKSVNPAVTSTEEDNIAMNPATSTPTLGEFITYKTREKVFKEEEPTYSAIQSNEILSNVAKGLDKITASKVSFDQEETEQGKSTRLKIGKFELYRSAR